MKRFTMMCGLAALLCVAFASTVAAQTDAQDTSAAAQPPPQDTPPPPLEELTPKIIAPFAGTENEPNLRFNFRDAPLDKVLDYLSEAAGFVIVREAKVEGTIDIVSQQPLNRDDAVKLLNTVLNNRGFAVIREDRTLTIVTLDEAKKKDIPVRLGEKPEEMKKSAEMVTQIIPVRHADATQLLENLTPLLPEGAVANANKSSNAIVLTDTATDVKRMAQIVQALDTSISGISEVRVFTLMYSKAGDTATLLTTLFQPVTEQQNQGQGPPRGGFNPIAAFFGRGRRGGPGEGTEESVAKLAASRVVAVADERTNAVVVAAPGEMMALIESIIKEIDRIAIPTTEVQVFALKFSDASEMASIINDAFGTTATAKPSTPQPARQPSSSTNRSGRSAARTTSKPAAAAQSSDDNYAHATADYRTNSIIVVAEPAVMEQVADMVEKLETNPAKQHKVFVYKMKNADVQQVAAILQGMINQQASASQPRQQTTTRAASSSRSRGTSSLGGRSSLIGR